MQRTLFFLLLSCCFVLLGGCGKEEGIDRAAIERNEIMVSAAASLTDALTELQTTFENEHTGIQVQFNFGSSGKLATQIEKGAPADLFLSASEQDMDRLEKADLIDPDSRINFTKNTLVLIANEDAKGSAVSFEDITPSSLQHFAIGDPESVPAGRYSKEVLVKLGLWAPLQGKLVYGSDVRQVLTHVEMGNADYGIVYSSDAAISKKTKVLASADEAWHTPIVYPGAVTANTKHSDQAKEFLTFLQGEEGKAVLRKYGFQ
ncbi:putative ABC transporter substrate-binding lipoprotein YvgL [Sporosarcina sp. NCCP-2222]|uniref:molybdate ABC transporter substrate-binding protein n=1 Tax=Sporosarcina sp. NCCP-2222 TaxID=2935073 RepID=UPI002087DD0C|nr:molybdate ABC transporter substrate-binding protein [Sporosarcina sp. NCCP-2222]GKV57510.1 putative ABC transporter substrate-binding lipoprotein YvgL [Sporosarcina sp. NCCP-2222]